LTKVLDFAKIRDEIDNISTLSILFSNGRMGKRIPNKEISGVSPVYMLFYVKEDGFDVPEN
jgi:hypothetical protein